MSNQDLHVKYRPETFDEMIGQDHVVQSLKSLFAQKNYPHAYLFTGSSGTGKTTVSRIVAKMLGCDYQNILEIDAASFGKVEDIRELVTRLDYATFGTNPLKYIIVDECFGKGSLVTTSNGTVAIETIKPNDLIKNPFGTFRVSNVFENKIPLARLVKVNLANGKQIFCSNDHLFFTNKGWIEAKNLNHDAIVFSESMSYNDQNSMETNNHANQTMCNLWEFLFGKSSSKSFQKSMFSEMSYAFDGATSEQSSSNLSLQMPVLRKGVYAGKEYSNTESVFEILWGSNSGAKAKRAEIGRNSGKNANRATRISTHQTGNLGTAQSTFFGTHEREQPFPQTRSCGKNERYQNEKRYSQHFFRSAWWKWFFNNAPSQTTFSFGMEPKQQQELWNNKSFWDVLETGSRDLYWTLMERWRRLSTKLQSGYWFNGEKSSDRSGWTWTHLEERYRKRFEKRAKIDGIRVDCVESYQRGHNDESFSSVVTDCERDANFISLYDLEVEGHPSYYVEGCLVHNCHACSRSAWQAFLKTIEEPPPHVYFAFCTTEADKVPDTIKTRCHTYHLRDVSIDDLIELVNVVAEAEEIKLVDKATAVIAQAAQGSPRRALTYLSKCRGCVSIEDVRSVLEEPDEEGEVIELCRMLVGKVQPTWKNTMRIINSLQAQNPESIRLIVMNYMAKVAMNARTDADALKVLNVMNAFSRPYNSSEKFAPLLLSLGELIFGDE